MNEDKQFFIKQFLKPTLMQADKNIKDVRYQCGANGELITIEHAGMLSNIHIVVTDMCKTNIIREVLKHI